MNIKMSLTEEKIGYVNKWLWWLLDIYTTHNFTNVWMEWMKGFIRVTTITSSLLKYKKNKEKWVI